MVPKFRFFGKVADGEMRMVLAESIDFKNGFVYYSYHEYTVEGDEHVYGDLIGFEDCVLMQSTGLFDKNCNEIFEGDIVVNQYGRVGYVAYLKQEAGFVVVLKKSDYRLGHRNTGESYDVTNDHEVIGDIYQNKELVEEK